MTQQYLADELSLLLGQLQAAMTNEASVVELAHLRQRAETGPRSALTSAKAFTASPGQLAVQMIGHALDQPVAQMQTQPAPQLLG